MNVDWTAADQRRFDNLFAFVVVVNRLIPRFVRFGPTRSLMVDLRLRKGAGKPPV